MLGSSCSKACQPNGPASSGERQHSSFGLRECPNWTGVGNDRFGGLDGNFWLTMSDRLRCIADRQFEKMIFTAE
jgi:hypothetical protein